MRSPGVPSTHGGRRARGALGKEGGRKGGVHSCPVLPPPRLEQGNLRSEVCALPGAQPRFSRDGGAGGLAHPRENNAWGAPELTSLGRCGLRVMSRPSVVGKNSNEALPHEIKPRSAYTAEGDSPKSPP